MDERENGKEVRNVGNEHENVTSEYERKGRICEAIGAQADDRNGEQGETGEIE
jgi:hypothetical protein